MYATENFVTYIDAILQFMTFVTSKKRGLELPTRLQRIVIDPIKYKELRQSLLENQGEHITYSEICLKTCRG